MILDSTSNGAVFFVLTTHAYRRRRIEQFVGVVGLAHIKLSCQAKYSKISA